MATRSATFAARITSNEWCTRQAYTLKQASIGQIVAEHTATAWNAVTGRPSAWTHRFYHFDLLGNTTAETDVNGMVANIIDMEAFGTVLQGGQAGFRLTTKEYDPEAGAYYFNARWYDNRTQRWLQQEPTGLDGPNLYRFALNNPVVFYDPNGLLSQRTKDGIETCVQVTCYGVLTYVCWPVALILATAEAGGAAYNFCMYTCPENVAETQPLFSLGQPGASPYGP